MSTTIPIVTGLDLISLEVIRNRLDTIANETEIVLRKSSYSPIVQEALDASAAIFDAEGNTLTQACGIPVHLGVLVPSIRRMVEVFPPSEMREGDVYVANDPTMGAPTYRTLRCWCPSSIGGGPPA